MNVCKFLRELSRFYDVDKKEEDFNIRVSRYAKILTQKEEEWKQEIDYDKSINQIVCNYPYRMYPNFTEILKNLVYIHKEKTERKEDTDFHYRNFRITNKNGMVYEFVLVPSSWGNVPSMSQFKDCKIEEVFDDGSTKLVCV